MSFSMTFSIYFENSMHESLTDGEPCQTLIKNLSKDLNTDVKLLFID